MFNEDREAFEDQFHAFAPSYAQSVIVGQLINNKGIVRKTLVLAWSDNENENHQELLHAVEKATETQHFADADFIARDNGQMIYEEVQPTFYGDVTKVFIGNPNKTGWNIKKHYLSEGIQSIPTAEWRI